MAAKGLRRRKRGIKQECRDQPRSMPATDEINRRPFPTDNRSRPGWTAGDFGCPAPNPAD